MVESEQEEFTILVVGHEEGFSPQLVKYATSMAKRMGYGIAALNIVPMSSRLSSFIDTTVKENMIAELDEKSIKFRYAVEKENIKFRHLVKFGDVDKSIRDAHKDIERISFTIAEPDYIPGNKDMETAFPVFSLLHS